MSFARFESYLRHHLELSQQLATLAGQGARHLADDRLALLLARLQIEAEPVGGDDEDFVFLPLAAAVTSFIARNAPGSGISLSPLQRECFAILDDLFAQLTAPDELVGGMRRAVAPLRIVLARIALTGADLFADLAHPARALLEFAVRAGRGWDRYAGRRAEELPAQIESGARRLAGLPTLSARDCEQAVGELADFLLEFNVVARATEQRLLAAEQTQLKQQAARDYVAQLVGTTLAGRPLPAILLSFLGEIWSKYLHTVFLRDGLDSEAWSLAVGEIDALLAVLDEPAAGEERRYATTSFATLSRVNKAVESIHHSPALAAQFFAEFEAVVVARLEARPLSLSMAPAPVVHEEQGPAMSEVPAEALRRVRALRVGDWLCLREGERAVRCKLADKELAHGSVLLVNYSGVKIARRDFVILAAEFARGDAFVLARRSVFEAAMPVIERGCELRQGEAKRALIEAMREHELERSKQLAEELASEELRAAEERARRAAEAQVKAEREAALRAYQDALGEVAQLQVGGWVELCDGEGKRYQAKLALVMASSRKLVFANRQGQRAAEMTQEQLAQALAMGEATITNFGVAFDQTLQALVQRRREQLS